jgi:DNA-binding NtrC family response regulator
VAINCAALPENLVESELFGIEKGVATGVAARVGKFEEASGGTLFLDEIGDLPLAAQAKILRVLQERTLERVGGRRTIPVDVRIVVATHKDLAAAVADGSFRSDLYYRLKVIHLETVPLREVPADVPMLAQHFLAEACHELGKPPKQLSQAALRRLTRHGWPGNVRELQNEMKRVAVLAPRKTVGPEDLSDEVAGGAGGRASGVPAAGRTLHEKVEALERRLIRDALEASGNNQQRAALDLGLSRQGLIKKMKRYGLHPKRDAQPRPDGRGVGPS